MITLSATFQFIALIVCLALPYYKDLGLDIELTRAVTARNILFFNQSPVQSSGRMRRNYAQ